MKLRSFFLFLFVFISFSALAFSQPSISIKFDKTSYELGETIIVSYKISGGAQPFYSIRGEEGCKFRDDDNDYCDSFQALKKLSGNESFTANNGDCAYYQIYVLDANLKEYTKTVYVPLTGDPYPPISIKLSADKENIGFNENVKVSYQIEGVEKDFTATAYIITSSDDSIDNEIELKETSGSFNCSSGIKNYFKIQLRVDDRGRSSTKELLIPISGNDTNSLHVALKLSSNQIVAGNKIQAEYNISGGTPPYTSNMYFYYLDDPVWNYDGKSYFELEEQSGKIIFTPSIGSLYNVRLDVSDSEGRSESKEYYCKVKGNYSNTLTIPNGTTVIKENAFSGTNAVIIKIPASVQIIESKAFSNCENLKRIYFYGSPESIANDILDGSTYAEVYANDGSSIQQWGENNDIEVYTISN